MKQDEFIERLRKLFLPKDGDREYERKETEATRVIESFAKEFIARGNGEWDNDKAAQFIKEAEWSRRELKDW